MDGYWKYPALVSDFVSRYSASLVSKTQKHSLVQNTSFFSPHVMTPLFRPSGESFSDIGNDSTASCPIIILFDRNNMVILDVYESNYHSKYPFGITIVFCN